MKNWKDIRWFEPHEFDDRYNKHKGVDMDMEVVERLEMLRDWIKEPVIITAGFDSEGHSPNSYHYKGMAADFIIKTKLSLREQWKYIRILGFSGIGIYPEWRITDTPYRGGWHLDTGDDDIRPQIWRKEGNKYLYFL